jgi:hypothetical protein
MGNAATQEAYYDRTFWQAALEVLPNAVIQTLALIILFLPALGVAGTARLNVNSLHLFMMAILISFAAWQILVWPYLHIIQPTRFGVPQNERRCNRMLAFQNNLYTLTCKVQSDEAWDAGLPPPADRRWLLFFYRQPRRPSVVSADGPRGRPPPCGSARSRARPVPNRRLGGACPPHARDRGELAPG